MLGGVVCGVAAANYGGSGLANLGVWKLPGVTEWARMSSGALVLPREYDVTDRVVEWRPFLDGFGFAADGPGGNRILRARLPRRAMAIAISYRLARGS